MTDENPASTKERAAMKQSWNKLWCVAAIAMAAALPAQAQDYPTKSVTIISPAAAGNSTDIATRLIADRLTQIWKQQVVVLNRAGAGGRIAAQAAAGADKDGYPLYMTISSTWTVLPVMQEGKLPFDLHKAFVPIAHAGEQPIALAVNKDVPANNVAELIELANKTPGGMLYATSGRGGVSHLCGELLRARAKVNLFFVHSPGVATSLNDVIAGRIPISFEGIAGQRAASENGSVRLLATAAPKRLPNLPNVPTIAETVPDVVAVGWLALMGPTGIPDSIVRKISADVKTALANPEVVERYHVLGTYPVDLTPEQLYAYMRAEERRWWPVVREVNREQATTAR
jgi:tripartite-type tricarboxylate transporter receptor subunit TctC